MRRALLWSIFAITSISTGVAVADDKVKGTYAFVGMQVCLAAPSGFANDSKGNPTIPNGNNSFETVNNFQGLSTYNGDGTGKLTGTFVAVTPPPPDSRTAPKAGMSGGTFSYSFTYTPILNNSFTVTATPGTYQGTFDYGPPAGQQFTIDILNRALRISTDQKYMTSVNATPYVENITYSGSPQSPVARSCISSGSQSRID
jgi:hypothetical protein